MFLKEIAQVLDQFINDPKAFGLSPSQEVPEDIIEWYQKVQDKCLDDASSRDIISELKEAQNKVSADKHNEKSPFYFMLIAYTYHVIPDWSGAILYAERAESQFNTQGKEWYRATSNWLSSLLYCVNRELDIAQTRKEEAIKIISRINKRNYRWNGEFSYRAKHEEMIETINKTYSELQNRVFPPVALKEFLDIICRLKVPDNDPEIQEWWEAICSMEPSNLSVIDSQIDKLRSILTSEVPIATPFDIIFLAHCYNLGFYSRWMEYPQTGALDIATVDFVDYLGDMNEYNQSLVGRLA